MRRISQSAPAIRYAARPAQVPDLGDDPRRDTLRLRMPARLFTRDFALLTLAHLLQAIGWSSMLLLPLYLDAIGATRGQIGAIMGSAAASGLLARPAVAWALETLGRKPALIAGTLIMAAAMGLVLFVHDPGPTAYAVRLVFGLGVGALFTGYFTFAADVIPTARRTEGIALFGISGLVPLAINPLAHHIGVQATDLRWFLPLMGVVILSSLVPLALVNEPPRARSAAKFSFLEALRTLKSRALWPCWFATIAFSGIAKVFMAFATVCAEHRGIPHPPDFWLTYALGAVCVRAFGARLPDRVGPVRFVGPAIGCAIVASLLLAYATTFAGLLAAGLLAGIGHGYAFPVLTSLIVTRSPDHLRGSTLAMFTALWEVTGLTIPPLMGALADATSDATMFQVTAGLGVLMLLVWRQLERRLGN